MSLEQPTQFAKENEQDDEPEHKQEELEISEEQLKFYEGLEPQGDLFVGSWDYDVEVDPNAETFYFSHENKTVHVAPQLIERADLSEAEQKFVFNHELGHLTQLLRSPDAYLETFEIQKEKTEEVAEEFPEAKNFARQAWQKFFNVFLDVHDNSLVQDRDPDFREGGREENVPQELYDRLSPADKMDEGPKSMQFINALLRKNMTGEDAPVSEDVQEVLDKKLEMFGEKHENFQAFVDEVVANPHNDLETVLFYLENFVYDEFEKLLRDDIKEGRREIPDQFKDMLDQDGGMMDEETAKEIADEHKEAQKSPDEKAKEEAEQDFKDRAEEAGFSEAEAERMLEIKERTKKVVRSLEALWDRFIQVSSNYEQSKKEGFKRGSSISPKQVAQQLPTLLSNPSQAEIFTRNTPELESESIKPKKISLQLVVDLSGSMENSGKKESVQEVSYAIGKSLINFLRNSKLDFQLEGKDNPMSIDLNMVGFGDSTAQLLERTPEEERQKESIDSDSHDLDMVLMDAVTEIKRQSLGGTQDAQALRQVEEYMSDPEYQKDLQENENVAVVLEITDGETQTVDESRRIIDEMAGEKNVYPRAIQIPGPVHGEGEREDPEGPPEVELPSGTFKDVWGDDKGKKLKDLSALKQTVVEILYEAFQDQER